MPSKPGPISFGGLFAWLVLLSVLGFVIVRVGLLLAAEEWLMAAISSGIWLFAMFSFLGSPRVRKLFRLRRDSVDAN